MAEALPNILNFGIVVFILGYFGRKPFLDTLSMRSTSIGNHVKEATDQAAQAQTFLSEWETSWKNAEAHTATMKREAEESIQRQREKAMASARTEATRIQRETELVAKSEGQRAKHNIQKEIAGRSITLAQEFLARQLSEKDQKKLVIDYVEGVKNG